MAFKISEDCISCGACQIECPNGAIFEGGEKWKKKDGTQGDPISEEHYYIMPDMCTECVGFFDEQQCLSVCPVEAPAPSSKN